MLLKDNLLFNVLLLRFGQNKLANGILTVCVLLFVSLNETGICSYRIKKVTILNTFTFCFNINKNILKLLDKPTKLDVSFKNDLFVVGKRLPFKILTEKTLILSHLTLIKME